MKYETFQATLELKPKFRGQCALLVKYLLEQEGKTRTIDDIVAGVEPEWVKLLNPWALANGGVKGSVRYHLRRLRDEGMVKINVIDDGTPEPDKPGPKLSAESATLVPERGKVYQPPTGEKRRKAIERLVKKGSAPNIAAKIVDGESTFGYDGEGNPVSVQ